MRAVTSLKFWTLMGSFCLNHVQFQLRKYRRVISCDTESDTKFWYKLTCSFKHDIRNLVNFHANIQKSEIAFSPKVWAKKKRRSYRGVIFHDIEQRCKIWINLGLVVSKLAWGIGWTFIKAHKSLKICTLMGSFCPKRNNSARKFQRNFVSWHWKVMQNLKENWLVAWKMT